MLDKGVSERLDVCVCVCVCVCVSIVGVGKQEAGHANPHRS